MADFYVDHDVAVQLGRELRALDHSATTARDLGQERATDGEQLLTAATRSWILVSHNKKDFRLLHNAWLTWRGAWSVRMEHAGVLVIPYAPAEQSAQRVHEFTLGGGGRIPNEMYEFTTQSGWTPWP